MLRGWRSGAPLVALLAGIWLGGPGTARAGQDICAEPNGSPTEACAIAPNTSLSGFLDTADDVDRYRFQVEPNPATIQARLGSLPGNYSLRLEDFGGGLIADGAGETERALEAGGLPAGPYFLVVASAGDANPDQPYQLTVGVQPTGAASGSAAAPAPVAQASAPPTSQTAERPLDGLVLRLEEVGERAKASKPKDGSVAGAKWYEVTFKRDSDPQISRYGPELIVNRVYRADSVESARRIFQEQARGDYWPEASKEGYSVGSIGPERLEPAVGEEATAFGGCTTSDCGPERRDRIYRQFRIVFRSGSLVQTLYTYGYESGNYFDVAHGFARLLDQRLNTAPAGPPPEIATGLPPTAISLVVQDAGPEAVEMFRNNGADGRASWTEVRFERGQETITQKLGPTIIYNKVFVAGSSADAHAIYTENAVRQLPEATEKRGAIFEEDKTKPYGNESYAVGACNDDCEGANSEFLHERLVYRWGNVVVILYIWGREDVSNPDVLSTYAATVAGRIK